MTARLDGTAEPERGTADVGELSLHYVAAGPPDGDLVVCLHGFPDFWYTWREQLPALADAGLRVVAPDMRGYGRSDAPAGVGSYALDDLVDDVAGLIQARGRESAHVVGHDWGGLVAWQVAIDRPALADRLAILNAPHPGAYRRDLASRDQLRRSWYAFAFQLPWLPERALSRDDFAAVTDALVEGTERPDAVSETDLERYRETFRGTGLSGPVNYYRALFRRLAREELGVLLGRDRPDQGVEAPTLVLWGERDPALRRSLTMGLERWVSDLRVERFPDAGHWVHVDEPERVNEALVDFL